MKQTDETACRNKRGMKTKTTFYRFAVALAALSSLAVLSNLGTAADSLKTEANTVAEITFDAGFLAPPARAAEPRSL